MDADLVELARRLVAHPRWEWRRGAIAQGRRGLPDAWFRVIGEWSEDPPDLTDAATGGVLLGMLPGAWSLCRGERDARLALARSLPTRP